MQLNKKNKLLLVGFGIALYACYAFAFSKTISYYKEYASKKDLLASSNSTILVLPQLQFKEKQLDSLLLKNKVGNNASFQNELLKTISSQAAKYNLKIIDFKEPHSFIESNQTIVSYHFSLQGSYNGSLKMINYIENTNYFGVVKHLDFTKKRNYLTNKDELFTQIILQKME